MFRIFIITDIPETSTFFFFGAGIWGRIRPHIPAPKKKKVDVSGISVIMKILNINEQGEEIEWTTSRK
jgi:hypothetical protein